MAKTNQESAQLLSVQEDWPKNADYEFLDMCTRIDVQTEIV